MTGNGNGTSHGSYGTTYRSFGWPVPYWLWKLTPSRYRELVLS